MPPPSGSAATSCKIAWRSTAVWPGSTSGVRRRRKASGDRHAEKLTRDRLGRAFADLGDHASALGELRQALSLAEELGDGSHEADLLWRVAIACAELGRRDQATAAAQASVDRMRRLRRPRAEWYAYHLANFHAGPDQDELPKLSASQVSPTSNHLRGAIDTGSVATSRVAVTIPASPGLLRMAFSTGASMAKFVESVFQTTDTAVYQNRILVCSKCGHHKGLRCRMCGCFTAGKARLNHERCPINRWLR